MPDKIFWFILVSPIFFLLLLLYNNVVVPRAPPAVNDDRERRHGALGIAGGLDVDDDSEFPFQLKIFDGIGYRFFVCGGSIIDSRIGITAAHCFRYFFEFSMNYLALAGSRLLVPRDPRRPVVPPGDHYEQLREITEFRLHPKYKFGEFHHDIALFRVDREFSFNKWVNKIRIPNPERPHVSPKDYYSSNISNFGRELPDDETLENLIGMTAMATGWGLIKEDVKTFILQKVELSLVNCYEVYKKEVAFVDDAMICAGQRGTTTCNGDSGGPLTINSQSSSPLLIGITSWTKGLCGTHPGVFTDLRNYTKWIHETSACMHA